MRRKPDEPFHQMTQRFELRDMRHSGSLSGCVPVAGYSESRQPIGRGYQGTPHSGTNCRLLPN